MLPTMPNDSTALVVQSSRWTRLLRSVGLLPDGQVDMPAGADFVEDIAAQPGYAVDQSMSAYAAFPWVYAAVQAIATDLSGLPITVSTGEGKSAKVLDSHPILDLIRQPSSRVNGVLFRRQQAVDLVLSGDWYASIATGARKMPESLLRLSPQRTTMVPQRDGQIARYEHQGAGEVRRLDWEDVLHVGLPSWEDDPSRLYGTGAIRPLHEDLTADLAASKTAAKSAQTGRPSGVFSPADKDDRWSQEMVEKLKAAYQKQFNQTSGALFLGGAVDYKPLGWSPRDMEFPALRELTREAVIAVLDVPPARLGLPNANYATASAQAQRYWEGLQGRAALLDAAWTWLARRFPGSASVVVRHDFSRVEALQIGRTAALDRVMVWVSMGVPMVSAAAYEGFSDAPAPVEVKPEPASAPAPEKAAKAAPMNVDLLTRSEQAAIWHAYIRELHTPRKRVLSQAMRRFLRGQAARVQEGAAAAADEGRSAALDEVWNRREEDRLLSDALRPVLLVTAEQARARTLQTAGTEDKSFAGLVLAVSLLVSRIVGRVNDTTEKALVRKLSEMDPEELAATVAESPEFQPARADLIATTETTAAVSTGQREAAEELTAPQFEVRKLWLSQLDDIVRDTHDDLHGDVIDAAEDFYSISGDHGWGPGLFDTAAENANCRCYLQMSRIPLRVVPGVSP